MARFTRTLLLSAALMGTAVFATGCATTAKGVTESAIMKSSTPQKLSKTAPPGTAMAVVRYPAHVEEGAKDAFYKAYGEKLIGGKWSNKRGDIAEMHALADSMVLKSNYFALSLYKELAAKMPAHNVLLSPHVVKMGADGKLTSEPMTQAESLPNVVTVDFATYTFPDTKKMMGKEPLSFGDLVTPLVTVRTDHRASAPTQGLLMASAPIMNRAAGNSRDSVNDSLSVIQSGRFDEPVPELDFIAHLKGDQPLSVMSRPIGAASPNAVTSYPLEKIKLNKAELVSMNMPSPDGTANAGAVDPLKNAFSKGFANQIVGIINKTDIDKAAMTGRASAIANFDESLAALTLVGSQDADYQARYRYAERLLEAEQKYLSVQSLRLFDGVHNGEMGAQVRDMLKAEYEILEKRRKMARDQNKATAFAILGAVATGAIMSQGGGGQNCGNARTQREYNDCVRSNRNRQAAQRALTRIAIAGTTYAGSKAFSLSKQSKAVGSNYLSAIVPALEEQQTVQVNLIDSNETITAIRFEDLRAKLQTLYNSKQRSLETVATRCGYTHDGSSKTGTWLGVCANGLANGSGVGVIRNADGSSIEYYGYAQNGQPQGPGYMITHTPTGSSALEGNFTAGRADGAMRVSKSGQSDRIMSYQSGQSTGKAPSGSQVASPFVTSPRLGDLAMTSYGAN